MSLRRVVTFGAALAVASAVLTACAPAPEGGGTTDAAECVRMVTNSGGLEDRSFNQSSWKGLQQAEDELGVEAEALVSTSETDLAPNVRQAVDSGCPLVVTVGWELAEATLAESEANPDVSFAIVDETVDAENVKPVVFDTAQASFLAGYLAAGVSKTGVVATFGGGNQPPVTLFMDGFVDGVARYNEVHGTDVRALGWNKEEQDGSFTGDFEDINKGKVLAEGFIDQGADVILPVAGQVGEGAAAAAVEHGSTSVIWVDSDGYDTLPAEFRPVVLTSVLKNTQQAMVEIVRAVQDDTFSSEPYVGTLENGGVEIAPFHDLESLVTPGLQGEIEGLRQAIIAGELVVESPSAP
ncbi:BMP family ABC transporter substrate-binding protein [Agromyces luteolus]|uniref:BMP family ABC transporter substrate-binding protein n=1 Tax=Agromyces luteolus TaxID=88373 RepID=A0A7C9LEH3_9MICO|nr:BMP family ABC transporter substrate-binding protein [Agromyces luteolus]MUN07070.1 BMP family ABC transporter substrate-binding protein [Agromyces luteolus]GLK28322.1 BMP family ABC transporter substrate-binding protein [Agromyces luteolus]